MENARADHTHEQQPSDHTRGKHRLSDDDSSDGMFTVLKRPSYRGQRLERQDIGNSDDKRIEQGQKLHRADSPPSQLPSSQPSLDSINSMTAPSIESDDASRLVAPLQTVQDLRLLEKPVKYTSFTDNTTRLPQDVHGLCEKILAIANHGVGIFPLEVKDRILTEHGLAAQSVPEQMWEARKTQAQLKSQAQLGYHYSMDTELDRLESIKTQALISKIHERDSPGWNLFVHMPLLELAYQGYHSSSAASCYDSLPTSSTAAFELCTTAAIAPQFVPKISRDHTTWHPAKSDSQTVDIVLCLSFRVYPPSLVISPTVATVLEGAADVTSVTAPDVQVQASKYRDADLYAHNNPSPKPRKFTDSEIERVREAIIREIKLRPLSQGSINQTEYPPLARMPIAISIVTSATGASTKENKIRLGLWTAAWHKRIVALADLRGKRIITLPLLMVVGHDWKLFFACDRGAEGIEICGGITVGSTYSITDLYKLLATIRLLAEWVETEYATWIAELFLPSH
ncbi:hypothetical protein F4777DRAFT_532090 [Nemania sp. FL0916]|nr:hypothetical protein F4777DRAFT_532090 [Nemania sp. FL0916]